EKTGAVPGMAQQVQEAAKAQAAKAAPPTAEKTKSVPGMAPQVQEAAKAQAAKAAPPAAPGGSAEKTGAEPGMAQKVAAGKPAAAPPPKPQFKSTGEMKAAKTEMLTGITKDEAMKLASEAAGKPAPQKAQKTEQFKAVDLAKLEELAKTDPAAKQEMKEM